MARLVSVLLTSRFIIWQMRLAEGIAKMTTLAIVFAGIMSNTAAELGYVVLIPLSAIISIR